MGNCDNCSSKQAKEQRQSETMEENQWLFKASAAVCLIGVLACTTVNGERVPITYPTNYHYYYYNYQLPNCTHETFLDKHFCQECFTPHDAAREYMPEEAHYSPTPGRWTGVWKHCGSIAGACSAHAYSLVPNVTHVWLIWHMWFNKPM